MNVQELEDHFRFTWPGFSVRFYSLGGSTVQMILDYETADSSSGQPRDVGYVAMTDSPSLEWARQTLRRFVLHEVDEHIKWDGNQPFNPHAPGVDPDPLETEA